MTFPAPAPYEPIRSTYEQRSDRGVKTDKDLPWQSCGVVRGRRGRQGRQRSSAEIGQLLLPSLVECEVWSVKCGVCSVKCEAQSGVGSVECDVASVEC